LVNDYKRLQKALKNELFLCVIRRYRTVLYQDVVGHFLNKIKLTFKQYLADYVTGNLTTSQLPKLGLAGLEQGLDSDSLTILAGMSDKDNQFEIEDYFKKALTELEIILPDKREAALELAKYYADEIIAGKVDPVDGVNKIIRKALDSYDFFNESKEYAMDSIDFQTIYGLYWTYDDLCETDHPWSKEKTNDELIKEVKVDIINELKVWREKNDLQQNV
jgi:hypothetical protein